MRLTPFLQPFSSHLFPVTRSILPQLPRQFPSVQPIFSQYLQQPHNSMMNPKTSVSRTGTLPTFALSSTNVTHRRFSTDPFILAKTELAEELAGQSPLPKTILNHTFQTLMEVFETRIGAPIQDDVKEKIWDLVSPERLRILKGQLTVEIYKRSLSGLSEKECTVLLQEYTVNSPPLDLIYSSIRLGFLLHNPDNITGLKNIMGLMVRGLGEDIRKALQEEGIHVPN